FTILFYNWDTVEKFADMNPKPAADQVKISYQPILASWECWTPNVFAGSIINPIIHIINDDDNFQDLENARLEYKVIDKANTIHHSGSLDLPKINYYDTFKKQLEIQLPENTTTGDYKLIAEVVRDEKIVSTNYYNFFIANDQFARKSGTTGNILVYDGQGDTQKALRQLDIPFRETTNIKSLPKDHLLIIGENAADKQVASQATLIRDFISK